MFKVIRYPFTKSVRTSEIYEHKFYYFLQSAIIL